MQITFPWAEHDKSTGLRYNILLRVLSGISVFLNPYRQCQMGGITEQMIISLRKLRERRDERTPTQLLIEQEFYRK